MKNIKYIKPLSKNEMMTLEGSGGMRNLGRSLGRAVCQVGEFIWDGMKTLGKQEMERPRIW